MLKVLFVSFCSGIDEKVKNRSSALPGKDENSSSTRSQDIKIRESLLSNMASVFTSLKIKIFCTLLNCNHNCLAANCLLTADQVVSDNFSVC